MSKVNLVIFGVTSNLAKIKLIPSIFDIFIKNEMYSAGTIYGLYRQDRSADELKQLVFDAVLNKYPDEGKMLEKFWKRFKFLQCDFSNEQDYFKLKELIGEKGLSDRLYYLATHPKLYSDVFRNLEKSGLNNTEKGFVRVLIEKPIGHDLKSSEDLNNVLNEYYCEDQIYRIDHYLAKETIQNILAFRFNNPAFSGILSKDNVDHIQITSAENFGVDTRAGYFDEVGNLRDMGQSHLLQMLAIVTMDSPKIKSRLDIIDGLIAYPDSLVLGAHDGYDKTDTFFAFKAMLNSGKLAGIPVYVRAGKKLKKTVTEVVVVFKGKKKNMLIYRIQPNEGIIVKVKVKKPGEKMSLQTGLMQFCFKEFKSKLMGPYEKIILDAIKGDQTYFNNAAEIRSQWKFIDALKADRSKLVNYADNSWGPIESEEMIKKDGKKWEEPSDIYCNR